MNAAAGVRLERLQRIAKRWPRSAWDYRGLGRWLSFDESYWTAVLAMGLLVSTAYLDVQLLAHRADPLPLIGELGRFAEGRFLLILLVLCNGWVLDRLLAAQRPAGLREVPWVRGARAILAAIPLLGLAIIPLWQRITRYPPSWAFVPRPATALDLKGRLPSNLGLPGVQTRIDTVLRSRSQDFLVQAAWLIGCQLAPWFSGLYLLARNGSKTAVAACAFLHVAGAGAGLAHSAVRSRILQMPPGRALAFRLLPLTLLLPVPISFAPLLLWLPASEDTREGKGIVLTLYQTRTARRTPLAATRSPRQEEIPGDTEDRRRRAAAGKILLLFFESATLARLTAAFGLFVLPVWATSGPLLLLLLALSALPGLILLFAVAQAEFSIVGRASPRWPITRPAPP